jgi:tripartite-type tricarboxylate transporter receptor subunit TctC
MKLLRRQFLHLAACAAALPAVSRIAKAQTYPARPITIIVPFAAGGPNDALGRIIAEQMRASLGRPIIIENVPGANGSVGVGRVVRAAPDGYTVSIGSMSSHVLNGAVYRLSYDLIKDLEPVAPLVGEPTVIVGRKGIPADDLGHLVAWLRANPGKASAAIQGVGNMGHLAGILFQKFTNTSFEFVPYRGTAPAILDLVAGQVDICFDGPSGTLEQLRAGTIKAYAVADKSRSPAAPDIPTTDEAGLPRFYLSNWRGLWAPRDTPRTVIAKLNSAVVDALAEPRVRARLIALGLEIFPREQQTPEGLRALQKAEIEKWWPIIKAANIKGE